MNPSPPAAEQRGRLRRDERSRSRERTPPHSSSHDADESSATVDPQNSVSNRSRSPLEQEGSRRQGHQKQKGKKTVAEEQPSEPPKAKKQKPIDSDEDDEEPQKEPGTSSNSQPTVQHFLITLMMKTVSTATNFGHKVGTPRGLCSTQISTF